MYRYNSTLQANRNTFLAQMFGYVWAVWNDALAHSTNTVYPGYNPLSGLLTLSKIDSRISRVFRCRYLHQAYKNCFASPKGNRRGKQVEHRLSMSCPSKTPSLKRESCPHYALHNVTIVIVMIRGCQPDDAWGKGNVVAELELKEPFHMEGCIPVF